MLRQFMIKIALLSSVVIAVPLEPGQPGGPWTEDEIDIVRDKVIRMMECGIENYPNNPNSCWRVPGLPDNLEDEKLDQYSKDHEYLGPPDPKSPPDYDRNNIRYKWNNRGVRLNQLIQLKFHDCLRYEDGSGGCDGCLNWEGMGFTPPRALANIRRKKKQYYRAYPINKHTTNNKLQLAARSLEFIFTIPNWPPGAKSLTTSLKESGKSRADLWQFASNIALEAAINETNTIVCNDETSPILVNLDPSNEADKCEIKLNRPVPFKWGRIDCIPDESQKWTPYPFEATKKEKHQNSFGTGTEIIKGLKQDFGFTAKETISLMCLHGLGRKTQNFEQFLKYKWIGGQLRGHKRGILHRHYFKVLNGKSYQISAEDFSPLNQNPGNHGKYLNGDLDGNPVGGVGFYIDCKGQWNNTERVFPGPCHFRPTKPGCNHAFPQKTQGCFQLDETAEEFQRKTWVPGCDSAELVEKQGLLYQIGGPLESRDWLCRHQTQFMFPFEAGFVMNFTIAEDNTPQGCGTLDGEWRLFNQRPINEPNYIYPGSPGYNGSPPCGYNTYAPEGVASAEIVELFSRDHEAWQEAFFNAWEKIETNGYDQEMLTEGPANGQLLAPFM